MLIEVALFQVTSPALKNSWMQPCFGWFTSRTRDIFSNFDIEQFISSDFGREK